MLSFITIGKVLLSSYDAAVAVSQNDVDVDVVVGKQLDGLG
jgi:hypothetical protein